MKKASLTTVIILTNFVLALSPAISLAMAARPTSPSGKAASKEFNLSDYALASGPMSIPGITDNASGLTVNRKTGALFVVINYPERVLELDIRGRVKRSIDLKGFRDTEGIAWIKDDRFAIAEEGKAIVSICEILPETKVISRGKTRQITVESAYLANTGLEGLCYEKKEDVFYAVKEKYPRKIYRFPANPKKTIADVKHPWNIQEHSMSMSDLSGIVFDENSGHLLILSHESKCIVECTPAGKEIGRLKLPGIPQAEGIAIDSSGRLFICSEPNMLYIFDKDKPQRP